jgi:hypothetical protein
MNKETIIQEIINAISAQNYLEIGVEKGKHFFRIKAPDKVAVDPHFRIKTLLKLKNFAITFIHYSSKKQVMPSLKRMPRKFIMKKLLMWPLSMACIPSNNRCATLRIA